MILYIDACVRDGSRTRRLAHHLLDGLDGAICPVRLSEIDFPVTDQRFLDQRDARIRAEEWGHPMFSLARQFALADEIVVAAPFWDLSFPASLKQYFEQINVLGVTFAYTPEGVPVGLCRAKRLYYVTTAGGPIASAEYGFGYVRTLAETFYGIPEIRLIRAEGLDVWGADTEEILRRAERTIDEMVKKDSDIPS